MNKATLIAKMMEHAARCKDDVESNEVSRAASRLEHYGALCEKPLTSAEIAVIMRFL